MKRAEQVLVLLRGRQLTCRQIADELNISVDAARSAVGVLIREGRAFRVQREPKFYPARYEATRR